MAPFANDGTWVAMRGVGRCTSRSAVTSPCEWSSLSDCQPPDVVLLPTMERASTEFEMATVSTFWGPVVVDWLASRPLDPGGPAGEVQPTTRTEQMTANQSARKPL